MDKIIFGVLIVLITAEVLFVNGFYIKRNQIERVKRNSNNNNEDPTKFSDILNFWSKFKDKVKGHDSDNKNNDEDNTNFSADQETFNELEMLQMIPTIIDIYRTNKITHDEKLNLSKIYGNLWPIIVQEAERNQNDEEMNPLLKALFDSFHLTKDITNDIDHNTVMEVTKKSSLKQKISESSARYLPPSKKLFLNVNNSDHPSQRLLNVAAMLIHQAIHSKGGRRRVSETNPSSKRRPYKILLPSSSQRRATFNLKLTDIPIEKITRSKRDLKIHFSGSNGNDHRSNNVMQNSHFDALLRIFKNNNEQQNQNDFSRNDVLFDDENENSDEDYSIDDENDRHNYFYDDLYEDDEAIQVHGDRSLNSDGAADGNDDDDYGSFQDLMLLAERHRLRREMEEERLRKRETVNTNQNIFKSMNLLEN